MESAQPLEAKKWRLPSHGALKLLQGKVMFTVDVNYIDVYRCVIPFPNIKYPLETLVWFVVLDFFILESLGTCLGFHAHDGIMFYPSPR
jgi:hypothetical protein